MAGDDTNFKDDSGLLSVVLGLVVLMAMSALPAVIGVYKLFAG